MKPKNYDNSDSNFCPKSRWGGKRTCAGRKRTCLNKVPFNRRINENILNILKQYAQTYQMTETEALESEKLCAHFGNCESFTFVEINPETKEIINTESKIPEEGISCQSASWISEQGASIVLAGGMGMRPQMIFAQNGVKVVAGCPELPIKEVVTSYLNDTLTLGENSCNGEHHNCHGHQHGQGCSHHHE